MRLTYFEPMRLTYFEPTRLTEEQIVKWSRTAPVFDRPRFGWPEGAPKFDVQVIVSDADVAEVLQSAEIIYRDLQMHGLHVFLDDRETALEVKAKDAETLAIPIRLILGRESLASGRVELITCHNQKKHWVGIDHCVERLGELSNEFAKEQRRI